LTMTPKHIPEKSCVNSIIVGHINAESEVSSIVLLKSK
jgi:hypothetical protein